MDFTLYVDIIYTELKEQYIYIYKYCVIVYTFFQFTLLISDFFCRFVIHIINCSHCFIRTWKNRIILQKNLPDHNEFWCSVICRHTQACLWCPTCIILHVITECVFRLGSQEENQGTVLWGGKSGVCSCFICIELQMALYSTNTISNSSVVSDPGYSSLSNPSAAGHYSVGGFTVNFLNTLIVLPRHQSI